MTGSLHQNLLSELILKCHSLGSFDQMEVIHVAATPADLYNAVFVNIPLAPFFIDCIGEQDLNEMNVEIIWRHYSHSLFLTTTTGEQNHECCINDCERVFDDKESLDRHMRDDHNYRPVTREDILLKKGIRCDWPDCGLVCQTSRSLEMHRYRAHTKTKSLVCGDCGSCFGTKHCLTGHKRRCTSLLKYRRYNAAPATDDTDEELSPSPVKRQRTAIDEIFWCQYPNSGREYNTQSERNLNELEKLFRNSSGCSTNGASGAADFLYFHSLNGVQLLTKMLSQIMNGTRKRLTSLTDRSNAKLAVLYELVCGQHLDVADYVLQSQHVIDLLDILCHRINLLDTTLMSTSGEGTTALTCDIMVGALCRLLSTIFDTLHGHYSTLIDSTDDSLAFNHIIQDVISYIVSVGMIDKLSLMMANTRGPVDDNPELTQCLQSVVSLFSSLSKLMALRVEERFGARLADDDTQLMLTFQMTHIGGVVSLIYGVILHSGAPQQADGD
ncbi:unnamed protein product [Medioppia subpectinata]|uniref:C2H2-type domain-containing protein n=1 Tax=Medioppia subpectinata TaxID=1979941 RepID=A0A7R9L4F8_9ACAR|nr:unnamed protein product [Medioppia subpectinata]CAG2115145.1 unnamed protein product [Medioppia subpectinata]